MQIKRRSFFKDEKQDFPFLEQWVKKLETANGREYERFEVDTALGKTHVWGISTKEDLDTLVIFPGARTTSLFWDFDKGLDNINLKCRIFLVETNGLPNFSSGATPDIKSLDYGRWANEVLEKLKIKNAYVAGASFGGLICMKLGITNPEKIKAAFLLNAGCLQSFSMKWSNLYYNLLPIIKPTPKNILLFLDKAIFSKPNHQLSPEAEQLIIEYEIFALTRYKDNTQKPYYMGNELAEVKVDTYILEGTKDLLFPYQQSIDNAKKYITTLKDIKIFDNVGHGIETYGEAMKYIGETIKTYDQPK